MVNNNLNCKICSKNFDSQKLFDEHLLPSHKMSKKKYLQNYYARYDLFDHSPIEFKSEEQYLLNDFNSSKNLSKWAETISVEDFTKYFIQKVKLYSELKGYKTCPSYLEICLIKCIPSIDLLEKLTGSSFYNIIGNYNLSSRYDYTKSLVKQNKFVGNIIIDTREQLPFKFSNKINTSISKLDFGDYSTGTDSLIAIERKSLGDLRSTLSSGFDRFQREIIRAINKNGYLVILVESKLSNFLYQKGRFGKCSPEFLSHKIRFLSREYGQNIQFVFAENRRDAQSLALDILASGENIRNIDLQYTLSKCR